MTDAEDTQDPTEPTEHSDDELAAYDLDHDGKISVVEGERARLGLVDARLEEIVEHGGLKGKIADGLHRVIDKLDND